MILNSDQLKAFCEVTRSGSFSKAALILSVSQPALTQRIQKLEEQVGTPLLIREGRRVEPTEVGRKLFDLSLLRQEMEQDFLRELSSTDDSVISGVVRIAGFSSVARSVILPALTNFFKARPHLQLELLTLELGELTEALQKQRVDYALSCEPLHLPNVTSQQIGFEEYVLVEARGNKTRRPNLYFDHDFKDQTTYRFFKATSLCTEEIQRAFVDEVYAILDVVELGWGRAVLPLHLIKNRPLLQKVDGFASQKVPVYLNYFRRPFNSTFQKHALATLLSELPKYL